VTGARVTGGRRRAVALVLVVLCLGPAGCTSDELVHTVGQTLYNAGHYVCTQSSNCDTAGRGGTGSGR